MYFCSLAQHYGYLEGGAKLQKYTNLHVHTDQTDCTQQALIIMANYCSRCTDRWGRGDRDVTATLSVIVTAAAHTHGLSWNTTV